MSNFVCPRCGMTNIDCGKDGYKTSKEIEYERRLKRIKEVLISNKTANGCKIHNTNCEICYFKNECMGNKILKIIESEE